MPRYHDRDNNRLVDLNPKIDPDFWDKHWQRKDFKSYVESNSKNDFLLTRTKKFLKAGRILEGGCGQGGNVLHLSKNSYDAYGVDNAKETVRRINQEFPELRVSISDVQSLDFDDGFFDGYWSLGVIEHFFSGYEKVLNEMNRVLKPEGIAFVTFPYICPIRKVKRSLGMYEEYKPKELDEGQFYQFILDQRKVTDKFHKMGFKLIHSEPFDALKGLKDEVSILGPLLQRLYDYSGKNPFIRLLRKFINGCMKGISAHMILIVLKKIK